MTKQSRPNTTDEPDANWLIRDTDMLREKLAVAGTRLRNLPQLVERMAVEAPPEDPQAFAKRLRKTRDEIVEKLADAERGEEATEQQRRKENNREERSSPPPPPAPTRFTRAREAGAHRTSAHNVRSDPSLTAPAVPWSYLLHASQQGWCTEGRSGLAIPNGFFPDVGLGPGAESLEHNSVVMYDVDATPFAQVGVFLFAARLHDDGPWWRSNLPDQVLRGTEVEWLFPRHACDSMIHCSVEVQVQGSFFDGADGVGKGRHFVMFKTTERDGTFPSPTTSSFQINLAEFHSGGPYNSELAEFVFDIAADAHARGGLKVLCGTHLTAEDGLVDAVGQWRVSAAFDGKVPYTMSPTGPPQ